MIEDLRVVELKTESFMGIKLAELRPDENGDLVIIGGRNGQGKTSLLNAIECAIRGKSHHPGKPVREGDERAEINLDLGELKIRRRFKPDGTSTIKVSNAEGYSPSNPQTLLDSLAAAISFDPLEFQRMDTKGQLEIVRELAGVDTEPIETEYKKVFEQRAEVNAVVKSMTGEVGAIPQHDDVGTEKVSVSAVLAEIEQHQATNRAKHDALADCAARQRSLVEHEQQYSEQGERIRALEEQLENAKKDHAARRSELDATSASLLEDEGIAKAMPEIELDDLHKRLEAAEATNTKVAQNLAFKERSAELAKRQEESKKLTEKLQGLLDDRAKLIASAQLPVDGLSFGDKSGVTLNGIPFSQISGAESLRASVAIGIAMHPKLKVMLIRDGSLLDDDSMLMLTKIASENDYQVFIERVGNADAGAIVIEAGEIVGAKSKGEAA